MQKIKTIVVDDHNLFRKGLILLLQDIGHVEVCGEASDGIEFLKLLELIHPDIVFMDINMPHLEGDKTCLAALQKYPGMKIIAISMFNDMSSFTRMDDAGVKGYLLKNSEPAELKKAIETVMSGKTYYSQELLLNLVKQDTKSIGQDNFLLTEREQEILKFICRGLSNSEIADVLHLSSRTVETHRANLLEKTDSRNTVQLVTYAIKNKFVHI